MARQHYMKNDMAVHIDEYQSFFFFNSNEMTSE